MSRASRSTRRLGQSIGRKVDTESAQYSGGHVAVTEARRLTHNEPAAHQLGTLVRHVQREQFLGRHQRRSRIHRSNPL